MYLLLIAVFYIGIDHNCKHYNLLIAFKMYEQQPQKILVYLTNIDIEDIKSHCRELQL